MFTGAHKWYSMIDYNFLLYLKKIFLFLWHLYTLFSLVQTPGSISSLSIAFDIIGDAQR